MKVELFLLILLSTSFSSQNFLRKLDDAVTEESCKKSGGSYQPGTSAQCKVYDYIFPVSSESECVSGVWESVGRCTAPEITDQSNCNGNAQFISQTISAGCRVGDVVISGAEEGCSGELTWTKGSCSDKNYRTKGTCTASRGTWGICSNTNFNSESCKGLGGKWTPAQCEDTSLNENECTKKLGRTWHSTPCSPNTINENECKNILGRTWYNNECEYTSISETECKINLKRVWTAARCLYKDISDQTACSAATGGSKTWVAGKCVDTLLGETDCNKSTTRTWKDGGCLYKDISDQAGCKAATDGSKIWIAGVCVDETLNETTCKDATTTREWKEATCSDISISKDECENLYRKYYEGSTCNDTTIDETACKKLQRTWQPCSETELTKDECEKTLGRTWNNEYCKGATISSQDDCTTTAKGTWDPKCTNGTYTTQDDCIKPRGTWTEGHCSVTSFTTEETCQGTKKYYSSAETGEKCVLGSTILSSRTDKATCKEAIKWISDPICTYSKLTSQDTCEAKAEFTAATPAKCLSNPNSSSSFIKTINIALSIICLIF